ncbi:hypothetical protein IWW51_001928 [Coemansia sp. RSA 2702]|nr:hypothetical protein IWW51_001928 [Coemansia sp. RSA 2702]
MDIRDIFKETVSTTLGVNKNKRKVGSAPSMRELKEGGYGIVDGGNAPAKRTRADELDAEPDAEHGSDNNGDDEEGGRFFADGLTTKEKDVIDWVDHADALEDALDRTGVQRLVVRLERAVSKNTADRVSHPNEPEKFVESEAELDEAIQRLLLLANDVQYLAVLEELDALPTLVGLVAHDNADIALDVIQLAVELTAEDAWSHEGESLEERKAVVGFISAMARSEFFEVLGQNLRRLNEGGESSEGEADRQGVFQTLALVENLVSLDVSLAEQAVAGMGLLAWLQARIVQSYTQGSAPDSNQQYAAEIMSILLQTSTRLREQTDSALMDALLRCLAKYRKHTPDDEIAMEYLENIVDSICMLVATARGKQTFLNFEGVELLVLLQKQPQVARLLSLKILDYALTPPPAEKLPPAESSPSAASSSSGDNEARAIAKRYIDGLGLKYLFAILMHHGKGGLQRLHKAHPDTDERAVNCIASLLRLTGHGTPPHWRVLAKFVPSPSDPSSWKSHVDRIVELNVAYYERVKDAEDRLDLADDHDEVSTDERIEERYLGRMDAGLFTLQMTDIIIAFVSEEPQAKERIEQRLRRKGRSLTYVQAELAEYIATRRADALGTADTSHGRPHNLSSMLLQL